MGTRIVENADTVPGRLGAVGKSLADWYRFEQTRLQSERRLFRENLAGDELDRAMAENAVEQRRLDDGWRNSSIRRHVESRAEQPYAADGVERRVALAAPGGLSLAGSRGSGTSSTVLTAKQLVGYGAVFNRWADLGYFKEQIAPGAFANALKKSDVRCLFNHDANHVFGRSTAATLELVEDRIGLKFTCYLLDFDPASYGLARRIDRRDISGCSFSFTVAKDTWKMAARLGDLDERTILEIDYLYDVGPVTYPAYPQTSISAIFEKVSSGRASPPARTYLRRLSGADLEQQLTRIEKRLGINSSLNRIERTYRRKIQSIDRAYRSGCRS